MGDPSLQHVIMREVVRPDPNPESRSNRIAFTSIISSVSVQLTKSMSFQERPKGGQILRSDLESLMSRQGPPPWLTSGFLKGAHSSPVRQCRPPQAVENQSPDVIIVDEISTPEESSSPPLPWTQPCASASPVPLCPGHQLDVASCLSLQKTESELGFKFDKPELGDSPCSVALELVTKPPPQPAP